VELTGEVSTEVREFTDPTDLTGSSETDPHTASTLNDSHNSDHLFQKGRAASVDSSTAILPDSLVVFSDSWANMQFPRSMFFGQYVSSGMTVCIFVDQEFIVHGYTDGSIIISSIFTLCHEYLGAEIQSLSLFASSSAAGYYMPPQHVVLHGHTGLFSLFFRRRSL
jgi:hypothetical protein